MSRPLIEISSWLLLGPMLQGVTHATLHLSGPVQQAGLPATDARSQWEASLISGFSMYTGVATDRLRLLHVQGTPANSTAVDSKGRWLNQGHHEV